MADYCEVLLEILAKRDGIDSLNLSEELSVDHQKIVGAIKSLQSLGDVIECEQTSSTRWQLTTEGEEIAKSGSHEARLFRNIPHEGIRQDELMVKVGGADGKVGFSKAMSLGWISIDKKAEGGPRVFRKVDLIEDIVEGICLKVSTNKSDEVTEQQKSDCKKRKLIAENKVTSYIVKKGPRFTTNIEKQETELTQEMLASGSWKTKHFKPYNFNANGVIPRGGHLHPLLKVRTQFRQIFLEMGFTEMPTNNFVESSFWNFDALFQPQQHPARDAHDTFFLSEPKETKSFPMEYLEKVKTVHSVGGYGSQGYKYDWKLKEAGKNIMRTHTTGVSARMLYQLAIQPSFCPSKFFSIDRVFRNETLDATHLAEFHQIEGLVADYGLTLGDLMGYIQEFFKKYGIEKLKFKPAYNPYTEPSMEIFSYHEGLKKWVEIGNSGVFRPEMLLPMGMPKEVSVIAWGLSLERPTMIKYGIQNIRDLFGPRVDLQKVYDNPICRLGDSTNSVKSVIKFEEKGNKPVPPEVLLLEKRQDRVLSRLRILQEEINQICSSLKTPTYYHETTTIPSSPSSSTSPVSLTSIVKDMEKGATKGHLQAIVNHKLQSLIDSVDPLPFLPLMSSGLSKDHVVFADPSTPPLSVFILLNVLKSLKSIYFTSSIHSSLVNLDPAKLSKLKNVSKHLVSPTSNPNLPSANIDSHDYKFTLIWKDLKDITDSTMIVGFNLDIQDGRSISRYLARLIAEAAVDVTDDFKSNLGNLREIYSPRDDILAAVSDDLVEFCRFNSSEDKIQKKNLLHKLDAVVMNPRGSFMFGNSLSLADILVWSTLVQMEDQSTCSGPVDKWMQNCSKLEEFEKVRNIWENCLK